MIWTNSEIRAYGLRGFEPAHMCLHIVAVAALVRVRGVGNN